MSTILNTLKKLEEEKSVLEKNINLKGLLLQDQEFAYPKAQRQGPRTRGLLGGLMVGGALLGGLALYFFLVPETAFPVMENTRPLKNPPAIPEVKKAFGKAPANPGVPLARISKAPPEDIEDPYWDEDFFRPEDEFPLITKDAPIPEVEEPEGAAEIREIETLIQTAAAELESPVREEWAFALSGAQGIPGLNLRGIIFFSSNNPANHIFVATHDESNRKLRVGDAMSGATLETIEAQKAVFSYGGRLVETLIGK